MPTGNKLNLFDATGAKAELPVRSGSGATPVIGMVCVLRSWKGHEVFFDAIKKIAGVWA